MDMVSAAAGANSQATVFTMSWRRQAVWDQRGEVEANDAFEPAAELASSAAGLDAAARVGA